MKLDPILPLERTKEMKDQGWWRDASLLDSFDAAVSTHPEAVAVVDFRAETGLTTKLTYGELNERVNRIAIGLAHHGVERQDVVSFQLPNWWEFVAVNLACLRIGAVSNPLMPIFRERELSFMVDFAESKVLIIPKQFRGFDHETMLDNMLDRLPHLQHLFVLGGQGERSFEDRLLNHALPDNGKTLFAQRHPDPEDVVLLMYTSGTTGLPKGVMHCQNTLLYNIDEMVKRCELSGQDDVFMGSPLAHLTGFLFGSWLPIVLQSKMILLDIWRADLAWQLIADETASFAMGATPFLADLNTSEQAAGCNSERFRIFVCGGAPIPRALAENAAASLDIHLMAVWGMTECGVVTSTQLQDPEEKIFGTDGVPLPGCEVKVVDTEGNPVPTGTEGTLLQRGASTFVGYLKRPEMYGVDDAGFFDTGDLARIDADGYIRITGRSKDIIIRGGENIPVVEIENVLYRHPAIADCAVVAMPDERLGELGCCFATLNPGESFSFEEMIDSLIKENMAKSYWPERLEIIDEMPRTASGKIQKFELRQTAEGFTKSQRVNT